VTSTYEAPWQVGNGQSMLEALAGQKNSPDAEPLLMAGYARIKAEDATLPASAKARPAEAIEPLVPFYEATDRRNEAVKKEVTVHL
jgi:hypothetical protein